MEQSTDRVKKIDRFMSDEFLRSLQERILFVRDKQSSMTQIGNWYMAPGLYDDLLHNSVLLAKVRKLFANEGMMPSVSSGEYYPKNSDMPLTKSEEITKYQLILQLSDNEENWSFIYFSDGEIEEVSLDYGEMLVVDTSGLMTGRSIASTEHGQARLCYVDQDSEYRLLGVKEISKSSYLKYRNQK